MPENVKKIRELADFNVNTEISRDDLLVVATGPDTRRDSEGNADPVSAQTLKVTIEAIITAYNKSLIPPSGGGSTTDPSDRPNAEVPKPGGGTYFQDTTPFTAANLELMIGSGCGLTVTEECHDASEVSVDCSSADLKYKTKKLCLGNIPGSALSLDANDDLELVNGNLKVKDDVSGTPSLTPGGGLTLDPDGNLMLETDAEQFGFIAYINTGGGPAGTTDNAGGLTTISGKRVVEDRFTSWDNFLSFANNSITSSKGQVNLILESDITLPANTSRSKMVVPSTWPDFIIWGNKKIAEKQLGLNSPTFSATDFSGGNQRRAKIICDMSNSLSSNAFMVINSNISIWLVHFQVIQANADTYALFRCQHSGYLTMGACKVENIGSKNVYVGSIFEAIVHGIIEFRTGSSTWGTNINPNNPSDPFFIGGGKKIPAIDVKGFGIHHTVGTVLKLWDSTTKLKMVEYQADAGRWSEFSGPNAFTGDARIHFSGTNKFGHFLHISDLSVFYTNGPITSITAGSSTALTVTLQGVVASGFNVLNIHGWADGSSFGNFACIPNVSAATNASTLTGADGTAGSDYKLSTAGVTSTIPGRSDYPD